MFSTGSVVVSNISRARSMRASASHAIGDTPVSSRNRRLNVRRDMCARVASVPGQRQCKVFGISREWAELVAARVWHEPLDELRLRSLTLWRSHEAAGPCVGSCGAEVAPDEMEAQVDTSGYASRREDVAVVDEEAVGQHVDLGVAVLELSGPPPVGGGGMVVEDTSRGEQKRQCRSIPFSAGRSRRMAGLPSKRSRRRPRIPG